MNKKVKGLTAFEHPQFGELRAICADGIPYVAGQDLVRILGYDERYYGQVVLNHCRDDGFIWKNVPSQTGLRLISAKGIRTLLTTKRQQCDEYAVRKSEQLRVWIFESVFPQISEKDYSAFCDSFYCEEEKESPPVLRSVEFTHPQLGSVQLSMIDGKVYAAGTVLGTALGYRYPNNIIRDHCRGSEIIIKKRYIDENGIKLLFSHAMENPRQCKGRKHTERLRQWLFDDVIPCYLKLSNEKIKSVELY